MKNSIKYLLITCCLIIFFIIIIIKINVQFPRKIEQESIIGIIEIETTEIETTTTVTKNMQEEYEKEISKIKADDKMQWYKEYKMISEYYKDYIERDTIYDNFTKDELELLFRVVECEVTGNSYFINKVNVASVIFNRLTSNKFPNDIISILTAPQQFTPYSSNKYKQIIVTETTILACEYAYEFGGTVSGALYFDSRKENSWAFGKLTLITVDEFGHTVDEVGHSFYK